MSKENKHRKKEQPAEAPDSMGKNLMDDARPADKDNILKEEAEGEAAREWQAKYNELNDKYLRLYSEFDNYRKRTLKERIEYSKIASEDIILSLLPVIDDLERAISSASKTENEPETISKDGIILIYQKFTGLLGQKGLEVIRARGEVFDVDFHDALTNIPAPSEEMKGRVVEEVEKGYKLNGKVIRYSKVVVGT